MDLPNYDHVLPITALDTSAPPPSARRIRAVVTLLWPFSSSTRSCALLLGDPDFRLRRRRGQVRVRFTGASAVAVAQHHVGIGDRVLLSLAGARWEAEDEAAARRTPGTGVEAELSFGSQLSLWFGNDEGQELRAVQVDEKTATIPNPRDSRPTETPVRRKGEAVQKPWLGGLDGAVPIYSSPAFVRRARLSADGLLGSSPFDLFEEQSEELDWGEERPRKKPRFSIQDVKNWRFAERSPSPQPTRNEGDEEVDTQSVDEDPIAALQTENVHAVSLLDGHASIPSAQNMQPPPLPRLHMAADQFTTQNSSNMLKEPSQDDRPLTPTLQPLSSESLPLPSPFPQEVMQPQIESLPSVSSSDVLPASDQPSTTIRQPSGQATQSPREEPISILAPTHNHHDTVDEDLVENQTPSQLRKDRDVHPLEDDTNDKSQRITEHGSDAPLSKLTFIHELSDTEEDDGEMYTNRFTQPIYDSQPADADKYHDTEDATEDDADAQTEPVTVSSDDESVTLIHPTTPPPPFVGVEASTDDLPLNLPLVDQTSREPTREPTIGPGVPPLLSVQPDVPQDSTKTIVTSSKSIPEQEKDKVMAQTYRSLFGFGQSSAPELSSQQQQPTPAGFLSSESGSLRQDATAVDTTQANDRPFLSHQAPSDGEAILPHDVTATGFAHDAHDVPFQTVNQTTSQGGEERTDLQESSSTSFAKPIEIVDDTEDFAGTIFDLEGNQDVSNLMQTAAPAVTTLEITSEPVEQTTQALNLQTASPASVQSENLLFSTEPNEAHLPKIRIADVENTDQPVTEAPAAVPTLVIDAEPASAQNDISPEVVENLQQLHGEDQEMDNALSQPPANMIESPADKNNATASSAVENAGEIAYPDPRKLLFDDRVLEEASKVAGNGAHTELVPEVVSRESDQGHDKLSAGENNSPTSLATTLEQSGAQQQLRQYSPTWPTPKVALTFPPLSPLNSQTQSQEQRTSAEDDLLVPRSDVFPPTPQLTQGDPPVNENRIEGDTASSKISAPEPAPAPELKESHDIPSIVEAADRSVVKRSTRSSQSQDLLVTSTDTPGAIPSTSPSVVTKSPLKKTTRNSKPQDSPEPVAREGAAIKATPTRRSSRLRAQSVSDKQEALQEVVNEKVTENQEGRSQTRLGLSEDMPAEAGVDEPVTTSRKGTDDYKSKDSSQDPGREVTALPNNALKGIDSQIRNDATAPKEVHEPSPLNTRHRTPARKSLSTRLSAVPEVLSGWFTPRRSSRLQQDDQKEEQQHQTEDKASSTTTSSGIATSLSYFTPLSKISEKLNNAPQSASNYIDLIAVVTDKTKAPERSKGGPRDYFTIFRITDPSISSDSTVRVETFRPWHAKLPVAHIGDVILLRGYTVKSRARKAYLLSTDASSWCVWRYNEDHERETAEMSPTTRRRHIAHPNAPREEVKGPPVELGEEERQRAQELRAWWQGSGRDQGQS